MLKYIIIFCIIFFYNLAQGDSVQTGSYKQLVLVQIFPRTRFFYSRYYKSHDSKKKSKRLDNYLSEHRPVFDAKYWVIDKLLARDGIEPIRKCVNATGHEIKLDRNLLDDDWTKKLREKWPNLYLYTNEVENWETQFNDHGSCITENPVEFFKESLQLLKKYDVGIILRGDSIIPGKNYMFNRILNRISSVVGKKVHIDCTDSEDGKRQCISKVQICLNKDRDPVDCIHRARLDFNWCQANETVYYP